MKWRFTVELNALTGDYEVQFNNLSDPGEGVDYDIFMDSLERILVDLHGRMEKRRGEAGPHETELYLEGDETLN